MTIVSEGHITRSEQNISNLSSLWKFNWARIFIYNIRRKTRQIPIVQIHWIQGKSLCNAWRQISLRSPVLDAGGKTGVPRENLRKQVWTGNQMHMAPGLVSNPGPLVHSAGEEPLRYLLPLSRRDVLQIVSIIHISAKRCQFGNVRPLFGVIKSDKSPLKPN